VAWDQEFFDPIVLPSGKKLITLRDAAEYITELPKAEHDAEEWQAAMQALMLVAEHNGPPMFARIGVMQAINRHVERSVRSVAQGSSLGTAKVGAGSMTEARNYREGLIRRAATFRAGHPALEEPGPASCSTRQLEI